MNLIFAMNALPPSLAAIESHRVRAQKAFWIWRTSSQVLCSISLFSVYKGWAWVFDFARSKTIVGLDVLLTLMLCSMPFVLCVYLDARALNRRREVDLLLPLDPSESESVDHLARKYDPVDSYRLSAVSARQLVKAELIAMKKYDAMMTDKSLIAPLDTRGLPPGNVHEQHSGDIQGGSE